MAVRAIASLVLFLLLASSAAAAFDILRVLAPFKEYATFSKLLNDTTLAEQINAQTKVTVLVVDNNEITPLSTLAGDALNNALALHALPDYYDPNYFEKLPSKTATIPTLLKADGDIGMLHFSELPEKLMVFGSAVDDAPQDAEINKVVVERPDGDDLSVIEISKPIVPNGIESAAPTPVAEPEVSSTSTLAAEKAATASEAAANAPKAEANKK